MLPNLLALIEAGNIKEDDNTLALIQNISREHAHAIARWLALATGTDVYLRYMQIGQAEEHIRYTHAVVIAQATKGKTT